MAAVHELFKRLRSRRSLHKKAKDKPTSDSGAASQLSTREGVALPPVPPPGFLNLPDVSRDCVRCPDARVYDEIPAYAIDTRLDILRDAYLERKRSSSLLRSDMERQFPVNGATSHGSAEVGQVRDRPRDDDVGTMRPRRSIGGGEDSMSSDHVIGAVLRRQGTPWNSAYFAESPDQLDQWVSVPESLNTLHLDDRIPDTYPERSENVSRRAAPWYEDGGTAHDQWLHQTGGRRLDHGNPSIRDTQRSDVNGQAALPNNRKQYPSPPPGALSDDSGVSSPSSREGHDVSWRSTTTGRHLLRHYRQYSDSDSSTYYRQAQESANRWRHCPPEAANSLEGGTNTGHADCQDSAHARLDISSSDTYNEYDQNGRSLSDLSDSYPRDGHVSESMSPQEYRFYLGKIRNNLSKARNAKNFTSCDRLPDRVDSIQNDLQDGDASCDSIELTSVTSLSEISTLSEREINSLMEQDKRAKRISSQCQRSLNKKDKADDEMASTTRDTKLALTKQPSAFRPYPSKHRYAQSSTSLVERIKPEVTSDSMLLADRLSCRVTTSKPRPLSARVTSQKTGVPSNQHGRKTQNLLLSDLMRRNHDRQILVVI